MDVDIPYDDAECAEWCDEDGWCKGIRGEVGDCHGHVSALSDSGGRDGTEECCACGESVLLTFSKDHCVTTALAFAHNSTAGAASTHWSRSPPTILDF